MRSRLLKVSMLFYLLLVTGQLCSQVPQNGFTIAITSGFIIPNSDVKRDLLGGPSWQLGMGYQFDEQLSVSLNLCRSGLQLTNILSPSFDYIGPIAAHRISLYHLMGRYHFTSGMARPWLAIGIGLSETTGLSWSESSSIDLEDTDRNYGVGQVVEIGLDLSIFRFSYSYHLATSLPGHFLSASLKQAHAHHHRFGFGFYCTL